MYAQVSPIQSMGLYIYINLPIYKVLVVWPSSECSMNGRKLNLIERSTINIAHAGERVC